MFDLLIEVSHLGDVGAGKVYTFEPRGTIRVPKPPNLKPQDIIVAFRVCGDCLLGDGIKSGDVLTCNANFERCQLKADTICIVRTVGGELQAKKIFVELDGRIRLTSSNAENADECYEAGDVDIQAIVLMMIRIY